MITIFQTRTHPGTWLAIKKAHLHFQLQLCIYGRNPLRTAKANVLWGNKQINTAWSKLSNTAELMSLSCPHGARDGVFGTETLSGVVGESENERLLPRWTLRRRLSLASHYGMCAYNKAPFRWEWVSTFTFPTLPICPHTAAAEDDVSEKRLISRRKRLSNLLSVASSADTGKPKLVHTGAHSLSGQVLLLLWIGHMSWRRYPGYLPGVCKCARPLICNRSNHWEMYLQYMDTPVIMQLNDNEDKKCFE